MLIGARLLLVLTIVVSFIAACSTVLPDDKTKIVCVENREALLALDMESFNRTIDAGWRTVAQKDECQSAAADLIAEYRETRLPPDDLSSRASLKWHEGQARAFAGHSQRALELFSETRRDKIDNNTDVAWNLYVDATIAFLKRDRNALDIVHRELSELPEPGFWAAAVKNTQEKYGFAPIWPNNINEVEAFQRCFEKSYSEAYSTCNTGLRSEPETTTVTFEAEGALVATWNLAEPVDSFEFFPEAMPKTQRLEEWSLNSDKWVFDGQKITSVDNATFDEFSFVLNAATKFYDRKYVPVERVGDDGWAISSSAFAPHGASHFLKFSGFPSNFIIYANGKQQPLESAFQGDQAGVVYIGPSEQVSAGAATIIAGNNIPDWLVSKVSRDLEAASERIAERLGIAPETPPTAIISYEAQWESKSYKGGVLQDVITMHLRGIDLDQPDEHFLDFVTNLIIHEAVHVWNGTMFKSSENAEQAWVHEGSAEYIANRLWMNEEKFKIAATSALNQCRMSLGANSLMKTEIGSRGRTPYNCGHLVHLIAEQASLFESDKDVLHLWRELLNRAAENENSYDSTMFLAIVDQMAGVSATRPINRLVDGLSNEQIPDFLFELSNIGISVQPLNVDTPGAASFDLSGTVLRRLLLGHCIGGHGYWTMEDHFKLNTEDRCGSELAGEPEVTHLNGHSLIDEPIAVYVAALELCANDGSIVLTTRDGENLGGVECPDPLKALPALFEITSIAHLSPL